VSPTTLEHGRSRFFSNLCTNLTLNPQIFLFCNLIPQPSVGGILDEDEGIIKGNPDQRSSENVSEDGLEGELHGGDEHIEQKPKEWIKEESEIDSDDGPDEFELGLEAADEGSEDEGVEAEYPEFGVGKTDEGDDGVGDDGDGDG